VCEIMVSEGKIIFAYAKELVEKLSREGEADRKS